MRVPRIPEIIGIGIFLLLAVLPLVLGLGYALLYGLGLVGRLSQGFTLEYVQQVGAEGEIWRSFAYTLYIAVMSMGMAVGLALIGTVGFRRFWQERPSSYWIYFPLAIPSMVAAFFSLQLLSKSGLLARLVYSWGWIQDVQDFPDLINDAGGIGIIFTHAFMATPFLLIVFLNIWQKERMDELGQLAETLGARKRSIWRRIAVPMLLKSSLPTLVLYFVFVLGSYEIPLLLGREDPQMVSVLIARKSIRPFDLMDKPKAYVIAFVYAVLVLLTVVLLLRKRKIA
ncbi:MAG: ABC transporter permease subunit [Bacteroidota bacterium]